MMAGLTPCVRCEGAHSVSFSGALWRSLWSRFVGVAVKATHSVWAEALA